MKSSVKAPECENKVLGHLNMKNSSVKAPEHKTSYNSNLIKKKTLHPIKNCINQSLNTQIAFKFFINPTHSIHKTHIA